LLPWAKYLGWLSLIIEIVTFYFSVLIYLFFKKFDLIYTRDEYAFLFLPWRKKMVWEAHNLPRSFKLTKSFVFKSPLIVCITHALKTRLIENGFDAKKIIVAPDGVDLKMFEKVEADLRRLISDKVGDTQIHADKDEFLYSDITYKIRGACFKVWKQFRGAFKEKIVERALVEELIKQGLCVETQKQIPIFYESKKVGTYVPDGIVNNKVLVELKRKTFLTKEDEKQFWLYLKGSEYKVGLLINFGRRLEIKRRIYDTARVESLRVSAYTEGQNQSVSACIKEKAREKLNLPIDKKIILYTGHLYSWKGVQTLADASKYLSNNCLVVFVGGTEEDIRNFQFPISNFQNVKLVGYRPHSEIPIWLKAADVLVLPNSGKEQISREFTSPMKLFEYMASGRPIVASNLPSISEILEDGKNALLFEPDNPQDLAEKINRILSDSNLSQRISTQAYEDVKNYSWDKRTLYIYENIARYFDFK
jgi:GxxExxY protein